MGCTFQNLNVCKVSEAPVPHAGAPPGTNTVRPSVAAWMPCRGDDIGVKRDHRPVFTLKPSCSVNSLPLLHSPPAIRITPRYRTAEIPLRGVGSGAADVHGLPAPAGS